MRKMWEVYVISAGSQSDRQTTSIAVIDYFLKMKPCLASSRKCRVRNSGGAQRFMGCFSWLYFSGADWLGRQTLVTWSDWKQFEWSNWWHVHVGWGGVGWILEVWWSSFHSSFMWPLPVCFPGFQTWHHLGGSIWKECVGHSVGWSGWCSALWI